MEPLLSNQFPAATKSDWLAQVRTELKDENAGDTLRWTPDPAERVAVDPYYTADEVTDLPLALIQAVQKQVPGWLNTPEYALTTDHKADNAALRDALARGADAFVLTLPDPFDSAALSRLLDGIKLSDTPVFFWTTSPVSEFMSALRTVVPYQLKGGLFTNLPTGNSTVALAEAIRMTADSPQFYPVCGSSHPFHNAGATAPQELAFTLARLADVYDQLTDAGLTPEQLIPKTMLSVSVGTSYFPEIAKLRALRVLFSRFISAYSPSVPDRRTVHSGSPDRSVFIHTRTSTFYDAAVTPYTNLLRATTEAMAAIIGGCDALTVHPYDAVSGRQSEFSDRIARNVSVLLTEESYFDKVADPSAGSYYVENLTHQTAEAAWLLFLQVEGLGGFTKAVAQGFVQAELNRAYQAKVDAVRKGRVLVGVTKFRHDEATNGVAGGSSVPDSTGFLPERRLAEEFE